MSLETIIKHIEAEALEKRGVIIAEARAERTRILEEARIEADRIHAEMVSKEKALLDEEKRRILVKARLEARRIVLASKQAAIESCFEKASALLPESANKLTRVLMDRSEEVSAGPDLYIERIKQDLTPSVAEILFG